MENERIALASSSVEQAEKILQAVLESKNELSEFMPWLPYALTLEDSISNTERAISNLLRNIKLIHENLLILIEYDD
ncbi:MAG: hypothetical protein GY928_15920 [Colwellia sp.]|nr:hypothetical protein [Colwellia sp.]